MNDPASPSPRAPRRHRVAATLVLTMVTPLAACAPLLPGAGDTAKEVTDSLPPVPSVTVPPVTVPDIPATLPEVRAEGAVEVGVKPDSITAEVDTSVLGPIEVRLDGLGLVRFGEDHDSAVSKLTAKLGQPDDAGVLGAGHGVCGVIRNRDVRWDDLTVSFTDTGAGLRLSGWFLGNDITLRNTTLLDHPGPQRPGTPAIANMWGLQVGTPVGAVADLVAKIAVDIPGAQFLQAPAVVDPVVNIPLGDRILNVVLHAAPGGTGYVVESLWAFTPAEVICR